MMIVSASVIQYCDNLALRYRCIFSRSINNNQRTHSTEQFSIYATVCGVFFSLKINLSNPSKILLNSISHFYHVHRQNSELVKLQCSLYMKALINSVNDRFLYSASSVWPHICIHPSQELSGVSQGGRTSQTWHKYGAYTFLMSEIEHMLRVSLVDRYRPCTHYISLPPIRRSQFWLTVRESQFDIFSCRYVCS